MACDPETIVTSAEIANLKANLATQKAVVESSEDTTTTPEGKTVSTLAGAIKKIGWETPATTYTSGLSFVSGDERKVIERSNIFYAPLPSELPFSTTGVWGGADELKFYIISYTEAQHVSYEGVDLKSNLDFRPIYSLNVTAMKSLSPAAGRVIETYGYYTKGDAGAAKYLVKTAAQAALDGDVIDGYGNHTLANGNVSILQVSTNAKVFPEQYGAVGDGVADDYSALSNYLVTNSANKTVLLSKDSVYRITQPLSHTPTSDFKFDGNGSKIILDSVSVVENMWLITVNGFNIEIENIFLDVNKKAHRGLRTVNDTNSTLKDCILTNMQVENAYRASTSFQGGDGIQVRGGYDRVVIENAVIKNITMAAGAGISGSEGVFGITITRNFANTLGARYVSIINPYIENILSEDDTYYFDQDGIRLLGLETSATAMEEGSAKITKGTFKNCWGRSIKVQRNDCIVSKCSFTRTTGFDTGYGNTEVDFQYGSGQVYNINCYYDGFNPTTIVNSTSGAHRQTGFVVNGITALIENTTLDCAVQRFRAASPPAANYQSTPLYASNISLEGDTVNMIRYDVDVSTSSDPAEYAVIENCYATDITSAFLRLRGNGGNVNRVIINNCADKSATGTPLLSEISATADLSAKNILGMDNSGDNSGSWTATLEFGGGSTGISYSSRVGYYTKVGNIVTCTLLLSLANKGTSTGVAKITGLPYAISNNAAAYSAASIADLRNVTYSGQIQAWGEINTTRINLNHTSEAGVYANLDDSNFSNNSELILTIAYRTDAN